MPLMKVRSSDGSQWKTVNSLTFNDIELKNGIIKIDTANLYLNDTNTIIATQGWVGNKYQEKIDDIDNYVKKEDIINLYTDKSIIDSTDKYSDYNFNSIEALEINLKDSNKEIHAFMTFSKDAPEIKYSTTAYVNKGDNILEAKKNEVWELNIYNYNNKYYSIWKNWSN